MKTESEVSIVIPLSKVLKRVTEATRVSGRTVCRVLKEGENVEIVVAIAFSTWRKLRPKVRSKCVLRNFDEAVLRKTVHNFYLTEKQRSTLKAIHSKMCEYTVYGRGVTSMRLVLRKWDLGKFNSLNMCALGILALCQHSLCILNFSYMLLLNILASILKHFVL